MKILLIAPPVGNIGQAPPGIGMLTAWLRGAGHDCRQWDLGIETFHHFYSCEYLEQVARNFSAGGADDRTMAEADWVAGQIEEAKSLLRRPGIESNLPEMHRALGIVRRAGVLISVNHGRATIGHGHFDIMGALASWESLPQAIRDPRRNMFLPYLRERALCRARAWSPDLVGVSITYLSQLLAGLTLVTIFKQFRRTLPVLLGGAYLKAVQEDLEGMPWDVVPADGICIGDGEQTLQSFLQVLEEREELRHVPNLLIPKKGRFQATGCWRMTELDQAPVPSLAMEGLKLGDYLVPKYAIPLPISRGCYWHRCVYCNISNTARETYRCRSTERSLDDIAALVEQCGTNWFDFPTDSLLPRDLEQLARGLIERRLNIRWVAEVLLDRRLSDERIALLKRSGCCSLRFGLESGCAKTLRAMNKPVDLREASRIFHTCRRHGIKTAAMVIIGFPTETQAELTQTVDFLREHSARIDFVAIHPFSLVPGSPLASRPELAGIHRLPRQGVLTPNLPYDHTNPVAMRPEDLPKVAETIRDVLSESYPQSGQLWTCGIGGWLTFAASCGNRSEFFKQKLPAIPDAPE